MPGIIYSSSASSVGVTAGMKRAHEAEAVPTYGQGHHKKRKIVHQLRHTQPVQHIADPIAAEVGDFGDCKNFFDQQMRRAIAIQCKAIGFETARPDALEEFRGLVDSCMASPARYARAYRSPRAPELTACRHDKLLSTSAQVHEQRAPYRHGAPRLGVCSGLVRSERFRASRAAF